MRVLAITIRIVVAAAVVLLGAGALAPGGKYDLTRLERIGKPRPSEP